MIMGRETLPGWTASGHGRPPGWNRSGGRKRCDQGPRTRNTAIAGDADTSTGRIMSRPPGQGKKRAGTYTPRTVRGKT